jgi:integrase
MIAKCARSLFVCRREAKRRSSSSSASTETSTPRGASSPASSQSSRREKRALKFDPKPSDKFATVAEDYFKHIAKQRRCDEVERAIRRELFPRWETKTVGSITRQDMIDAINAIKARGKLSAAHHLFAYAQGLFSYAVAQNIVEHSPCVGIKPKVLIGAKEPRQRVLNDDELRAVWRVCERLATPHALLCQLLLVTIQRRSDVALACWREFDLDEKFWEIPAERFKSNRKHIVPLSQLALDILAKLPEEGRLFSITGFSKSKRRLDKLVLAELRKLNTRATLPNWTLHDLRRTGRTRLSEKALGVPYEVREAVIGHAKRGLDRVYHQYEYLDEKREALDAWAARLSQITSDTKAKSVIMIRLLMIWRDHATHRGLRRQRATAPQHRRHRNRDMGHALSELVDRHRLRARRQEQHDSSTRVAQHRRHRRARKPREVVQMTPDALRE